MNNIKLVNDLAEAVTTKPANQFSLNDYPCILLKPERICEPTAWVEHIPFAYFLVATLRPKILVELGVHTGNSYFSFCQTIKNLSINTSIYGVDTWIGDEHANFYDESIYEDISSYNNFNYSNFSSLIRGKFDDALQYFSDSTVDLLHIDGYHTYEAVKHDFESWLPKMSKNGVIILHDTEVRVNNFGVWRFFEEISSKFQTYQFLHGYGLGVVLVGENIPQEFMSFFHEAKSDSFMQNIFATLGKKNLLQYQLEKYDSITEAKELSYQKSLDELQTLFEENRESLEKTQEQLTENLIKVKDLDRLAEVELRNVELEEKYFIYYTILEKIKHNLLLKAICRLFGIKF